MVPVRVFCVFAACLGMFLAGCTEAPDDGAEDQDGNGGATAAMLSFREHDELGPILTDAEGMTLYVFTNDEPGESRCYNQCAINWPPLLSEGQPQADGFADRLNRTERDDGAQQVTYDDRPLYYFANDESPGMATGDGLNGVWFVVRPPPTNADMLNGVGPHEVETENITYHGNATGYHAAPAGGSTTGVVMIHEWWGLNDNIRHMARLLASHGYDVLAVDLFHGNVAQTAEEAMAQVQALNQTEANANMQGAADFLRQEGADEIVSLGWCFGGGQSLQLALSGEELAATVIYYGFLENGSRLDAIEWPVLGIFGEADQAISVDTVRGFESALNERGITNEIYIYPDVGHAFANPSGDAWAPEETKDAWTRTLSFLSAHAAPDADDGV